jgi:6-phosphogluconate dehydrogenase
MQIGMVGLGRMGSNMVRRLLRGGHECVGYDRDAEAVKAMTGEGATGAHSSASLCAKLVQPRTVWIMLPPEVVDGAIDELAPQLAAGDVVIDGGNSHYRDDIERARRLGERGVHYVDCGTSGGVFGLERGYCLMIGGEPEVVQRLDPLFATLAPGPGDVPVTPGREARGGTAHLGYLHCGPHGAGHFAKMVHNGIEYGLMAAYAEGFNILHRAGAGLAAPESGAPPLRDPRDFRYEFDLEDVAEVWRRGSVISSWLLDLTAAALVQDPDLDAFSGKVGDSGEGRWTIDTAVELGVPAYVLAASLFSRFSSRGRAEFGDRLLSAMRYGFGGHLEPAPVAAARKAADEH